MRSSSLLLTVTLASAAAVVVAATACGGSSGSACKCASGVCDSSGNCFASDGGTSDGGTSDGGRSDGGTSATCTPGQNPTQTSEATNLGEQVLDFTGQTVGTTVTFQVPQGIASITIVEQAVSAPDSVNFSGTTLDNTAVPVLITAPGYPANKPIFNDTATPTDIESAFAFFASDSPGAGSLTLPNTTGGLALVGSTGLPAGQWGVTVSDYAYECAHYYTTAQCTGGSTTSTYKLTIIMKPLSVAGAHLDMAIYFVADSADTDTGVKKPLTAAAAASDTDLLRMVSTLQYIFQQSAGITLNQPTFHDLDSAIQNTYASGVDVDLSGACAPLQQLLKNATDTVASNTMNIFFVSSFTATGLAPGTVVAGIDGTIPGPATINGTVASGAAVSVQDLRHNSGTAKCSTTTPTFGDVCGADDTAYVIAHETGHFLGLYHVTEGHGTSFDPLSDTAQCPCSECAPTGTSCSTDSYYMSVADCTQSQTCGGGDDLMFWLLDSGAKGHLTAEQAEVIGANPIVH